MSGMIYVFTGEGKGKTSAALGVATRSLLLEKKVVWVAFYKQESWGLAEAKLKEKFKNLEMIFGGRGFRISNFDKKIIKEGKELKLATVGNGAKVVDFASEEEHLQAAAKSLEVAKKHLQEMPFLLVMDEVLNAVNEGLIETEQLIKVLGNRGETHVVLTGRGLPKEIEEVADLVTECKKLKHPYDTGKLAVLGLDY
ncbi:MAG: cob(I)yrinic acid a,c-diamide adenosyltransferase [Candidatus Microgenomates bacterium]